jgi:hypothetical protein
MVKVEPRQLAPHRLITTCQQQQQQQQQQSKQPQKAQQGNNERETSQCQSSFPEKI